MRDTLHASRDTKEFYICRIYSTNRLFYAKQTQFDQMSNEHNILYNKGIWKFSPFQPWEKQTQNKPKQTQFQYSACPAPNRFIRNLVRGSSVLCHPPSVRCRFKPGLLDFRLKNSLTALIYSLKCAVSHNKFRQVFV